MLQHVAKNRRAFYSGQHVASPHQRLSWRWIGIKMAASDSAQSAVISSANLAIKIAIIQAAAATLLDTILLFIIIDVIDVI